jgi:pimeloyl-ACP methyl ester carboxylesterase
VLLPGAGHFLPQERPEQISAEITALLQAPITRTLI